MKVKSCILSGRWSFVVSLTLFVLFLLCQPVSAIELFSWGMLTPETISPAPAEFGTYGGQYFIPDPARGGSPPTDWKIWRVPAAGGQAAIEFTTNPNARPIGGLFLPGNWGSEAGKYLTTGWGDVPGGGALGRIYTYSPDGTYTLFKEEPGVTFSTPIIASDGFGGYGGQLFVTNQARGSIEVIAPDGSMSRFADLPDISPFGLAFAPAGFGAVGGDLLASLTRSGDIYSFDASGAFTLFTTIPLKSGQRGGRQMEFSPPGFIPGFGQLLFVSISGSTTGGGTLGDVVAIDSNGNVVESLREAPEFGGKFDPRGLYFTADGNLLISDASDPIWKAGPQNFQSVPEPSIILLLAIGLAGLVIYGSKRMTRKA